MACVRSVWALKYLNSVKNVFTCFVSVTDQNKKNYVFINQAMSWSSAQQYCRKNYKDLAMIENQEENTEAQNAKPSNNVVWIGLYREPWTWSDGSRSSFRNWLPTTGLNNVDKNQHCITENPQHQWADEFCNIPWLFLVLDWTDSPAGGPSLWVLLQLTSTETC
uniref:C-type lectin domain-containing protein n=1 Tax=Oryzias sinensis TaxID=183150 RepID=A0A8C7WUC6_9TELE